MVGVVATPWGANSEPFFLHQEMVELFDQFPERASTLLSQERDVQVRV